MTEKQLQKKIQKTKQKIQSLQKELAELEMLDKPFSLNTETIYYRGDKVVRHENKTTAHKTAKCVEDTIRERKMKYRRLSGTVRFNVIKTTLTRMEKGKVVGKTTIVFDGQNETVE